ncbi:ArsR/SmtB family transcription factor [Candidatus Electronema sp. JC]|uniref:ArsR/SmtB family transcription factor n=1 Tax=Candidatus Electronema sp. JC TaxID=3401570 RepID=UPI003AA947DC
MNEQEKARYAAKAAVLKALAHPTRLWMAEQLTGGEKCVCEFVKAMDFDFSTISKHLAVLKQAGIVEDEKRGKQVFYRLKVPCVLQFMDCVEAVLKTKGTGNVACSPQMSINLTAEQL